MEIRCIFIVIIEMSGKRTTKYMDRYGKRCTNEQPKFQCMPVRMGEKFPFSVTPFSRISCLIFRSMSTPRAHPPACLVCVSIDAKWFPYGIRIVPQCNNSPNAWNPHSLAFHPWNPSARCSWAMWADIFSVSFFPIWFQLKSEQRSRLPRVENRTKI